MKKSLPLLALVLLLGCSDDEKTYRDLAGTWEFSQENISGTFKISNEDDEKVRIHSGSFTINGNTYENEIQWILNFDHDFEISGFDLTKFIEGTYIEGTFIRFNVGSYNKDYTRIYFEQYYYKEECCATELPDEMITVKRKVKVK